MVEDEDGKLHAELGVLQGVELGVELGVEAKLDAEGGEEQDVEGCEGGYEEVDEEVARQRAEPAPKPNPQKRITKSERFSVLCSSKKNVHLFVFQLGINLIQFLWELKCFFSGFKSYILVTFTSCSRAKMSTLHLNSYS